MTVRKKRSGATFLFLLLLAAVFVAPIIIVLINSFKSKFDIISSPFTLPNPDNFAGADNYIDGAAQSGFFSAFGLSLFITVASVAVIILFCSMAAWYLTRVKTRLTRAVYYLFVFSMIVPFQMVMYTMTHTVSALRLNNPLGIIIVYLGFGSGLTVFLLSGFIKGIPTEVEEAAMIDGCSPLQTFFLVVFPLLRPAAVTAAILNAMWIWNDYLLPYLILGTGNKTIPVAIQIAMQGAYGAVDWGGMMAMLVLAIAPIIIFYLIGQKYIIEGVVAGAVKG